MSTKELKRVGVLARVAAGTFGFGVGGDIDGSDSFPWL